MQIAVARAVVAGRTLVVKEQGATGAERKVMQEMGTKVVIAYRSNEISSC